MGRRLVVEPGPIANLGFLLAHASLRQKSLRGRRALRRVCCCFGMGLSEISGCLIFPSAKISCSPFTMSNPFLYSG